MHRHLTRAAIVAVLAIGIVGCGESTTGEGSEESGTQLALDETYDEVRNGVHLILGYDVQTNSFVGTVENTTTNDLMQVPVEVHLNNEVELGPTPPADLAPGEVRDIILPANTTGFDRWSAHPEVGGGEHG